MGADVVTLLIILMLGPIAFPNIREKEMIITGPGMVHDHSS